MEKETMLMVRHSLQSIGKKARKYMTSMMRGAQNLKDLISEMFLHSGYIVHEVLREAKLKRLNVELSGGK